MAQVDSKITGVQNISNILMHAVDECGNYGIDEQRSIQLLPHFVVFVRNYDAITKKLEIPGVNISSSDDTIESGM